MVLGDYKRQGRKSLARAERAFIHLEHVFATHRALDITEPQIEGYLQTREGDGAALATMNYELSMLRRAFRLAVRQKLLPTMPHVPRFRVNNARKGFFERHELDALLTELPDYHRGWNRFVYLTGWRVESEVLTREWQHVDMKAGIIRLEPGETKNGEGRIFPFSVLPELQAVIEAQRAYTDRVERITGTVCRWVFHRDGARIKDFRYAWGSARKRAGIIGKTPHDYRRSAIRNLERAGVSRSVAMQLVGHLTASVYQRYAIVNEQDLKDGVAKLATLSIDTMILPLNSHSSAIVG